MIIFYVMLRVLIILSSSFAQPGVTYFHPEVKNRPTICPEKDSDVRLICKTANGTVSRMIIKRARDQKLLYTSPRASTSAEFMIENVQCVDMGVYQCIIDDIHIETTVLVLPECPPLPCHQEGTTMSVYADVNKTLDISLCVLVYRGILNYTEINAVGLRRKASINNTWSWDYYENQETPACFRNVTIVLKHGNWTAEDYGEMRVQVYSSAGETFYLDYNISVIPPGSHFGQRNPGRQRSRGKICHNHIAFLIIIARAVVLIVVMIVRKGNPGIVYIHPDLNNETTNCPKKDSDVRVICKTKGAASRMIMKRVHDQKLLYTSPRASTSAEFLIKHVDCMDMGVYQCIIDDRHTVTTVLVLSECPPQPCHQEGTTMSVYADVNKPLDISLCVLVYPGILQNEYIEINTVRVRRMAPTYFKWTWDYYENKETSACFGNVIIALKQENWTAGDYGGMSVRVYSSEGDTIYLDYNISVIPPGSCLDKETPDDKEALEKYVIFMSPVLIIIVGAVVLIVVMIVRKGSRHVIEENVVEEHVLEELPEAQAPENPQYEEIIHFRSDMPDKPVRYVNLISKEQDEEEQYAIPLPDC